MGTQNKVSFIIISTLLTGKLSLKEVRVHPWDSNPGLFGLQNLWILHHAASQSQIEPTSQTQRARKNVVKSYAD